jgi:hypothetical protein
MNINFTLFVDIFIMVLLFMDKKFKKPQIYLSKKICS